MLPNGTYTGKAITPIRWTTTPNKGSDQVTITLQATKGEEAGNTIDFNSSLMGGALEITRKQLDALGFDGESDESVMKNTVQFIVKPDGEYVNVNVLTGANYTPMAAQAQVAAKARLKAAKLTSGTNAAKTTEEEPF